MLTEAESPQSVPAVNKVPSNVASVSVDSSQNIGQNRGGGQSQAGGFMQSQGGPFGGNCNKYFLLINNQFFP